MSFVLSLFYCVGVTLHYYFNFLRICNLLSISSKFISPIYQRTLRQVIV